jgi:hypothetical protein
VVVALVAVLGTLAGLLAGVSPATAAPDGSAGSGVAAPGSFAARPGDRVVALTWQVPGGASEVVVRRAEGTVAPAAPIDGIAVYHGSGTAVVDRGLVNGTTYAYAAWALDTDGVAGPAAVVLATPLPAAATALGISAPAGANATTTLTVSGRLVGTRDGRSAGAEPVDLYRRYGTGGAWTAWSRIATRTTASDGRVSFGVRAERTAQFTLRHRATSFFAASGSITRTVTVTPTIAATLSAPAARTGTKVTLSGTVRGAFAGQRVTLQRRQSGRWVDVRKAALGASGAFRFPVQHDGRGLWSYRVAKAADSRTAGAVSRTLRYEAYTLHTYSVVKRGRSSVDLSKFAAQAAKTYADPRGWAATHRRFKQVRKGGSFTLVLAEAAKVPSYSSQCSATYSCRVGRYVIINERRWRLATTEFRGHGGSVVDYRHMVVNHETGHWLGNAHATCTGRGRLAPVMMQQSKGLKGCRTNPWPTPAEIRRNS